MSLYSPDPPRGKSPERVRCVRCGRDSYGYYYCFTCRRSHAERVRAYMAKRRQDPNFAAAERAATKLRMRRLRARRHNGAAHLSELGVQP